MEDTERTLARLVGAIGGLQRRLGTPQQAAAALESARSPEPGSARALPAAVPSGAARSGSVPHPSPRGAQPSPRGLGRPPLAPRGPSPSRTAQTPSTQPPPPEAAPPVAGGPPLPSLPLHTRLWDRYAGADVSPSDVTGSAASAAPGTSGAQAASAVSVLVTRFASFLSDVFNTLAAAAGRSQRVVLSQSDALCVTTLDAAFAAAVGDRQLGLAELMALSRVQPQDAQHALGPVHGLVASSAEGVHFLWDAEAADLSDPRALSWGLGWVGVVAQLGRGCAALPAAANQCLSLRSDVSALTGHEALGRWVQREAPELVGLWRTDDGAEAGWLQARHAVLAQLILETVALSARAGAGSYARACLGAHIPGSRHDPRACRNIAAIRAARSAATLADPPPPPVVGSHSASPPAPPPPAPPPPGPGGETPPPGPSRETPTVTERCRPPVAELRRPRAAGYRSPQQARPRREASGASPRGNSRREEAGGVGRREELGSRSRSRSGERAALEAAVRLRGGEGAALIDSAVARVIDPSTGAVNYGDAGLHSGHSGKRLTNLLNRGPHFFVSEPKPRERQGRMVIPQRGQSSSPPRRGKVAGRAPCDNFYGSAPVAAGGPEPPATAKRHCSPPPAVTAPWGSPEVAPATPSRGRGRKMEGHRGSPGWDPSLDVPPSARAPAPSQAGPACPAPASPRIPPPPAPERPYGTAGVEGPALRTQKRFTPAPDPLESAAKAGKQRCRPPQPCDSPSRGKMGIKPPPPGDLQGAGALNSNSVSDGRSALRFCGAPMARGESLSGAAVNFAPVPAPTQRQPSPCRKGRLATRHSCQSPF
eukprot:Hpha_TRINITY_DN18635_c0_g1::TRINITY_DN18635_c0_g1_i1::g.115731::m.115731